MVKCKICERDFEFINPGHLSTHTTTMKEYKQLFPHAELSSSDYKERIVKCWSVPGRKEKFSMDNPSRRPEVREKIRRKQKEHWTIPGNKEKISGENNVSKRPEVRKKLSINKEEYYKRYPERHPSKRFDVREKLSERGTRYWAVPGNRKKMSMDIQGVTDEKDWKGFIYISPYGLKFNRKLREQIRKRDNYRCQECFRHQDELYTKAGRKYKLTIHHIDYNKQNNSPENLISLCSTCHSQANYDRDDWTEYYQKKFIESSLYFGGE